MKAEAPSIWPFDRATASTSTFPRLSRSVRASASMRASWIEYLLQITVAHYLEFTTILQQIQLQKKNSVLGLALVHPLHGPIAPSAGNKICRIHSYKVLFSNGKVFARKYIRV